MQKKKKKKKNSTNALPKFYYQVHYHDLHKTSISINENAT